MNRIARVTLAVVALAIPVVSIGAEQVTTQGAGVVAGDKWCC